MTAKTQSHTPEPCPWCDAKPEAFDGDTKFVHSPDCFITEQTRSRTMWLGKRGLKAWNTRALPAATLASVRAALEASIKAMEMCQQEEFAEGHYEKKQARENHEALVLARATLAYLPKPQAADPSKP